MDVGSPGYPRGVRAQDHLEDTNPFLWSPGSTHIRWGNGTPIVAKNTDCGRVACDFYRSTPAFLLVQGGV